MKTMTVNEAVKLVKAKPAPAVSLYLATDVSDKDGTAKLRLNLQRLYKTAESLIIRTYTGKTRERLLRPLKMALSMVGLRRAKGGIGIYHNEHFTGIVKIPTITSDLAVAADSFHLKPLLRCVQIRRNYYVLAFKKRATELFLVTVDGTKMIGKFQYNKQPEQHVPGDRVSRKWAEGGGKMRRQKELKENMEQLNRTIESTLVGERLPLILAGPHHQIEAFREVCTYNTLIDRSIDGSVEALDMDAITNLTSTTMGHFFEENDYRSVATFRKAESTGLAITNLEDIAKAAARGQIQSLLVAEDRQIWGHLDRETGAISLLREPGLTTADDLLDDLAELTITKGGAVTILPTVKMPQNLLIAAVLRWSDSGLALPAPHHAMPVPWSRRSQEMTA